ncbi:MAG: AAA domain-containing protein, partial [Christensenellaceae bacterium]
MENKDKAINLFRYIMQLYALKYQVVSDINSQEWVKFVSNIPKDDENIIFNYMDRTIEESEKETDNVVLLQIRKPEFEKAPTLPTELHGWVNNGWDKYYQSLVKIEKKIVQNRDQSSDITAENTQISIDGIPEYIYFDSDKYRVDAFNLFEKERDFWASRQDRIDKTRRLFNELHLKCIDLDRDSETIEMMIGQGVLACELGNGKRVNHPVLLKKVSVQFDALNNVITIIDTDNSPEIYTMLLQEIDFINHSAVKTLKEQLVEGYYHPLDRNDTPNFLKSLTHRLHAESRYAENPEDAMNFDDKLVVFNNPVFFVRKRTGGVVKAIEEIIAQLEETGEVSGPLLNLIGENASQLDEMAELLDVSETLSAISGEDKDILLSKEANREQLEIAKRIERYNAVLVQGPPGTGKTHTIANLMGHFLAQGKSVLVTSHTKKALSVVKEKVAPELQHLCVSVLDENNRDMERSIDGITDYISAHSSLELLDNTEKLKLHRARIMDDLNDIRNKIFAAKYKEFETIVFGGESFSPSQAAKFVYDHKDELAYIPGKVMLGKPLPATTGDLELLYKTNTLVSINEEQELNAALPNPNQMLIPQEFSGLINEEATLIEEAKQINSKLENRLTINYNNCSIMLGEEPLCTLFNKKALEKLKQYLTETKLGNDQSEAWHSYAVLDGKKGGGFKTAWETLIAKIQDTYLYAGDNVMLLLGKVITGDFTCNQQTITSLSKMKERLLKGKKLNTVAFLKPKEWMSIYNSVRINDKAIETASDCDVLIGACHLAIKRNETAILWNELIEKRGGLSFETFGTEPEQVAFSHVSKIKSYLEWYETVYTKIVEMVSEANLNPFVLSEKQEYTSALDEVNEAIKAVYMFLPMYIDAAILVYSRLSDNKLKLSIAREVLTDEKTTNSAICKNLLFAIEDKNAEKYSIYYNELSVLYAKYSYINERERILSEIKAYAPEWAELIKNRIGIHGLADVPANIEDAWKWKQFAGAIDEITAMPFEQLQHKSVALGAELRRTTALLAENLAWYHLICRIEGDISQKQALQGWKLTVRKIGKGTGKTAPGLRKEAQRLMAKCQTAVPAWIMPINKALESLDPKTNKFDIVIIDEASQSDISALAILYLAKKIIIVGDDEQVSPSAIGVDVEKMENLVNMHIKGIIPNAHLYDMKSSLYDIAKTTFPTLMLREHFRCVPNIIGYSNRLSYDYKIKPLRDDSNVVVKPATVSYRVK